MKFRRNNQPDNEYIRLQLFRQNFVESTFDTALEAFCWEIIIQTAKIDLQLSIIPESDEQAEATFSSKPRTLVG